MFDLDAPITAAKLGGFLNLSERRVRELKASGVFPPHFSGRGIDGQASIRNYCAALSRRVEAREARRDSMLDVRQESAKLKRAQRKHVELKNQVLEGSLIPVELVRPAWARVARAVQAAIVGAPSAIRFALPHLTAFDETVIDEVLRDQLSGAGMGLEPPKLDVVDPDIEIDDAAGDK